MELNHTETLPVEFRTFLQEELARRTHSNPKYSMRTFAKFLDVESSRLSKMLRGQRPIRSNYIEAFGGKIGLSRKAIEQYKQLADATIRPKKTKEDKLFASEITVTTSVEKLNQAKGMIEEFKTRLISFLESEKNKNTSCQLSISVTSQALKPVIENELPDFYD